LEQYKEKTDLTRYKTLWDWLDLIIIPASIALFAWMYTEFEKDKNERIEEEKIKSNILESFINTMTELLVQHNLASNPDQKRLAIARTRINMALSQLDGQRKGQVLQFLYESDLIDKNPKFKLLGNNFNDAVLDNIVLGDSVIKGAYFKNASMRNANLNGIDLTSCNLENVDLFESLLENANLSYTILTNANLENIDLSTVDFEGANLTKANLNGATIRQSQLDGVFKKEGIQLSKTIII
jgi:uncharacterized protein YjbI with pentapeptide repeats